MIAIRLVRFLLAVGLLSGVLLAACATDEPAAPALSVEATAGPQSGSPEPVHWPTNGWRTSTPEAQGMDSDTLARMHEEIKARGIPLHSLLIIRNGYIVSETYFGSWSADQAHELYSVTKSVIATLVGIALRDGAIAGLQVPLAELLPSRVDATTDPDKATITLEQLLTMTSGLGWIEEDASFNKLYRSRDWVEFMLDLPMAREPGAAFSYCSGCSHLLSAVVAERTGENPAALAERELFAPLGIRVQDYTWEAEPAGLPIGGWGLRLTPRDMAKLGYLYLHQGQWDGLQILPAEWVAEATCKHTTTDGRLGYGYQWWTYPDWGAYAALGRGGQTIWAAPDDNVIVITTAATNGHDAIFDLIDRYIMPAVIRP